MEAAAYPWPALGVLLLRDGLVTKEALEAVLDEQVDSRLQRISSRRLGELLVKRGMVTEAQVAELVAEQYELPFVDLHIADIDLRAARLLGEELARRFSAVAVSARPDGSYLVAIADPSTVLFSEELRQALDGQPSFAVVGTAAIDEALEFVYELSEFVAEPAPEVETEMGVILELPSSSGPAADDAGSLLWAARTTAHRWPPLGALLVREGLVTEADLEAALAQQRLSSTMRLGEILVDRGAVTPADVARLVAEQYELPFVDLTTVEIDLGVAALLPEKVARRRSALPLGRLPDGSLHVVVADPTNVFQSDELRLALGVPLSFCVAAPAQIEDAIRSLHEGAAALVADPGVEPHAVDESPGPEPTADASEHEAPADVEAYVADITDSLADVANHFLEDLPVLDPLEDEPFEQPSAATLEDDELAASPLDPQRVDEADDDEPRDDASETGVVDDPVADASADSPERAIDEELLAEVEQTVAVTVSPAEESPGEPPEAAEDDVDATLGDEIDETIQRALALGATTIQLAPRGHGLVVRCRVDGAMRELASVTLPPGPTIGRLAELAGIDPSSRAPRRGLISLMDGERSLDLQVTSLPTKSGLGLSLHVPDGVDAREGLSGLGLGAGAEATLREALRAPSGVVLVCGPALSGKTTTLYAALDELRTPERALATVEDPVHHLLPDVEQVDVDAAAGVTFAAGLRAILHSGADTVLVGDLADRESAQLAFRGARGRRLVLASVDAPTASSALARLAGDLGLEARLVSSMLSCLVSQHLVRRICTDCRETYYASADEIAELGRPAEESGRRLLARGRGCASCAGTGYDGWAGVFEVLPLTDGVRALVADAAVPSAVREAAVADGMATLEEEATALCLDGVTTASEVRLIPRG